MFSISNLKTSATARIALYIFTAIFIYPLIVWSINTLSEGYKVTNTPQIITAHNTCKVVKSLENNEYFAPTKTIEEWNSFLNNTPQDVSVLDCSVTGVGCKLRYRLKSSIATSTWAETEWGGLYGTSWQYGPPVAVVGDKNTLAFEVAIMCVGDTSFNLGLRYRGNSGPYWNTDIGSHYADVVSSSGNGVWGSSQFTIPFSKSCAVQGGDGTCGFLIQEQNEVGPVNCDVLLKYAGGNNDITYGFQADKYGASTGSGSCPAEGCSIQMAIRCYNPNLNTSCSDPDTILAGGSSPYTVADCQAAGGTPFDTGSGCGCKFIASVCPSGWSNYDNWTETQSNTCTGWGDPACITTCSTASHSFSNQAIETCTYRYGYATDGCPWFNVGTCFANVVSVGCK